MALVVANVVGIHFVMVTTPSWRKEESLRDEETELEWLEVFLFLRLT